MRDLRRLLQDLERVLGPSDSASPPRAEPVAGGDSHRAFRLPFRGKDWFVKWNARDALPQFEAEAEGLRALAAPGCIAVPRPLLTGADDRHAWLVLPFESLTTNGNAEALGRRLARLHRTLGPAHGWDRDNYLGATPQANDRIADWPTFWWERRILPQWRLARSRGHDASLRPFAQHLERACRERLDHAPAPSLLHGDLWGGNHGYRADGTPVLFDPAPWHGDRETDLAMMRLFGGFDPRVFRAYEATWPLPPGAEEREGLYRLYHLLNHLNLFGTGWLGRVEVELERLSRRS